MKRIRMLGVASFVFGVVACGGRDRADDGTMTVQGTVSSRLAADGARAVAIGADGRIFWAYLDASRDFTLKLPTGQSYRIVVASQRSGGGQKTIGHVAVAGGAAKTTWIAATDAKVVDLGRLTPAASGSSSGLKTQTCGSACSGGSGDDDHEDADHADHDDDNECHEHDKAKSDSDHEDDNDDVCSDGEDVELDPSKDCGCGDSQAADKKDDEKSCSAKSGSGSGRDDGDDDDGDDDGDGDDKSGGDADGGSGSSSSSAPPPPPPSPSPSTP